MYTSEQINQIMQELGLSPTDASARNIIEQLANSKPNTSTIDASFISELRQDLQNRAVSMNNASAAQNVSQSNNLFSMFMNKTLAAALVVAVIVIGAGGVWYAQKSGTPLFDSTSFGGSGSQLLSGKYDVKSVPEESFGNLDKVAVVSTQDAAKLNATSNKNNMSASGMGSGGGTESSSYPTTGVEDQKLIAPGEPYPGQVYYEFKYEGSKDLPSLNATQPVLKRTKPVQPSGLVSRIVGFLSFGLIDLSTLQNVQLQNLSFIEDRDFGYGVYVDVQQGMVNMYQNWEKWPQPEYNGEYKPMKVEDLPKDADVMAAAETFIQQYKISKEGYGTPRVVEQWRLAYEAASEADRANFYIPEQIQIVYPLMLENKEVFDESGNVYGLNVMVDAKTLKVASVYELMSKQFERSDYKGESSSARILDIAEKGGFRNYYDPAQQIGKKVELKLGTPTLQMVKIYYSSDNYKTSSDLYMPALVFPIKNWKENNYWRQTVIVPLVKSILDTDEQQNRPIPLDNVKTDPAATTNSIEPAMVPATKAE